MYAVAVDDNFIAADMVCEILDGIDPNGVHRAYSDPLELLSDKDMPVEMAFLDIDMPPMNGITLAAKLRERFPLCEIVFVTGHTEFMAEAFALHASGYIMKPVSREKLLDAYVNRRSRTLELPDRPVKVKCFGDFEVFVKGEAVRFGRQKSKELLAYLIDRRGAGCTNDMIIGNIWFNVASDESHKSMTRVAAAGLLEDFRRVGVENIIFHDRGSYSVNTGLLDCDYYRYLECDPFAIQQFCGEYMMQYDFAENTRANLQMRLYGRKE